MSRSHRSESCRQNEAGTNHNRQSKTSGLQCTVKNRMGPNTRGAPQSVTVGDEEDANALPSADQI